MNTYETSFRHTLLCVSTPSNGIFHAGEKYKARETGYKNSQFEIIDALGFSRIISKDRMAFSVLPSDVYKDSQAVFKVV